MHNSIVHTENGFRGVPRGSRVTQRPIHYNVFRHVRTLAVLTRNNVGLLWRVSKKQDSENIVLILTSTGRLPLSPSFHFHPSHPVESASFRPQSGWLSLLHPVFHSICSSEVDMLCFPSALLVRLFTVNKISGTRHQPLLHSIRNLFVFVWVLPPIGIICTMCCPLSDIHSTVVLEYATWSPAREKIPSDPVAGRVRGRIVGQGSYKQKTLSVTRNMVV